jgi:hypothetical protein
MADDEFHEIAIYLVTAIKQNVSSFDEADFILRDSLFSYFLRCEQFSDAANILSGANLESNTRQYTEREKVDIFVKCAGTVFNF